MTNRYISRYAKHDTHFARTDPFKDVPFDEPVEGWGKVGAVGFILCLIVLLFI